MDILVFTYTASVFLVALAMFGSWCLLKELWGCLLRPGLMRLPSVTFLIMVKNIEQDVEIMLRHLIRQIEDTGTDCDVVVVDCNSDDLTGSILNRLAVELPGIVICSAVAPVRSLAAGIPLCRGAVIHVLDTVHRLNCDEFMVTVCSLLQRDSLEIAVRQRS